jgi:predicted TIM-barrel fold metal-dependent hydrolase
MDEYGVWAQVLYPNLITFETNVFIKIDPEFATACTVAYNDFLAEFVATDPSRFIGIAMVPFWDLEAAVAELERCRALGHRGVLFGNRYERIGLPTFYERHWDPILSAAEDLDLSVNFHIGFASSEIGAAMHQETRMGNSREHARSTTLGMIGQSQTIAEIVTTGLCDRHPRLKFVSVESGFGYVPYLLESLDWHFQNFDVFSEFPGTLLPSEYFRRQVFGTFWFETSTLGMLEVYPDNFMFETDYPHPTSLSPGPASNASNPAEHIRRHLSGFPDQLIRKVLHENASRLYHLD